MSTDYTKIQMTSAASSNKVLKEGTGTFTIPGFTAPGESTATATIAHGFGSDELLVQVSVDNVTVGSAAIPWGSNDNRLILYPAVDSTNLYITGIFSSGGAGAEPVIDVTYYYRILIP